MSRNRRKANPRKALTPIETLGAMPPGVGLMEFMLEHAGLFRLSPAQVHHLAVGIRTLDRQADHWDVWYCGAWSQVEARVIYTATAIRAGVLVRAEKAALVPIKTALEQTKDENVLVHLWRSSGQLALSDEQTERLHAAVIAHEAADATAEGKSIRHAAVAEALAVRDELGAQLAETMALAEARGERVTRTDGDGRIRFHDRDGLAALYDAGDLRAGVAADDADVAAKVRLEAALTYRRQHEARGASLRSALCGEFSTSKGSKHDPVAVGALKAFDAQLLGSIEAIVAVKCGARSLLVLRIVAGEGRLISSLKGGGKSMRLDKAALIRALDVAAPILAVPGYAVLTQVRKSA